MGTITLTTDDINDLAAGHRINVPGVSESEIIVDGQDFDAQQISALRAGETVEIDSLSFRADTAQDGSADAGEDINTLFAAVRAHPEFAFGAIFKRADFPGERVPDEFPRKDAQDRLVSVGNELIDEHCEGG